MKIKIGNLTEALNAMQDFFGRILSPVFLWNIRNIKKWINNKKQIKERRTTLFIFTYVSDILKKEKKKKTVFMLNWSDSQYIHISQRAQSHFAVEKSSHFSRSYPGNLSTWAKKPLGLDKLRHGLSVMTARNKQRHFFFFFKHCFSWILLQAQGCSILPQVLELCRYISSAVLDQVFRGRWLLKHRSEDTM